MLVIESNKSGKFRRIDLHSLRIGKTFAHKLNREDLYSECQQLGVPDIKPSDGWQQLALAYANWVLDKEEAVEPEAGDTA